MQVVVQQRTVGVLSLIELPLLGFGQIAAVGFHVGTLLLVDRLFVRHELLRLGRRQFAAFQSFANAGELLALAVIDLMAARVVLGELACMLAGVIAGSTGRGQRCCTGAGARLARVRPTACLAAVRVGMRMTAGVGCGMSAGVSTTVSATAVSAAATGVAAATAVGEG